MMDKVFGGSPLPILLRLLLLSFVVGLVLWVLGIDPMDLWRDFGRTIQEIWWHLGDFIQWAIKYVALGAIVVIPLWIIYRVLKALTAPKKS